MKKERRKFRMKHFEISDDHCGCRIGIDGTLIGSWTPIEGWMRRVLDAGCGCGLIALMIAQRGSLLNQNQSMSDSSDVKESFTSVAKSTSGDGTERMMVTGIDAERGAVEDAKANVSSSPFSNVIDIRQQGIEELAETGEKFDLIVSNPPFFESGGNPLESARMMARHAGELSPHTLIKLSERLLTTSGALAFIGPAEYVREYLKYGAANGLHAERICMVKGHPRALCKRVMLYMRRQKENALPACVKQSVVEHLIIKDTKGIFTRKYVELGRDFYLKF